MKKRKRYSAEKKVLILRELLDNDISVSDLSEKYQIHPNDIYRWKKKLFEEAANIFQSNSNDKKGSTTDQRKISKLESKLKDRDEAIAMLLKENIEIKKSIDGEI
jgi:transposase